MGNDDFSVFWGNKKQKKETRDPTYTYLPVRGRETLDGGGQTSGGEPDGFRAELFIGKRHAKHVERVHLGNVHALALAASHLAAADVLAVVVLWEFSF